jgi:hypothetical protein
MLAELYQEMAMRSANAVLRELVLHVQPPRGCAIVLMEWASSGPVDPNWVIATGNMAPPQMQRYTERVAELRKSDTEIDWSDVAMPVGHRRVALWVSEVESAMVHASSAPSAGTTPTAV